MTRRSGLPTTPAWPSRAPGRRRSPRAPGRGELEQLAPDLASRLDHGSPVVERRLAAGAAAVVRAGVGVLVGDREVLGRMPSSSAARIGSAITAPGAVLLGAGDDPAAAVGLDPDEGAGRTGRAEPPARRDADRLVGAERLAGLDAARRRGSRVSSAPSPSWRWRVGPSSPSPTRFRRRNSIGIEADPVGEDVVVLLDGPAGLRPGRRADRAGRRPVRVDADAPRCRRRGSGTGPAIIIAAIWPRIGVSLAYAPQSRRIRALRARIVPSSARPVSRSTTIAWVTLSGREELLAPAEDEPDRPPSGPGERGDVALEVEVALAAEPAAEMGHDDPDPVLGDLEDLRGLAAGGERDLGARVDRDPVAGPVGGDACAARSGPGGPCRRRTARGRRSARRPGPRSRRP